MAFESINVRKLNCVRVICPHDPALDLEAMEETDILDLYEEDPVKNEGLLKFKEGKLPSVFICNFEISGKEAALIKDNMSGIDAEKNPKLSFGSWEYTTVRVVLKDVENPGSIKFKKDSRGYVDDFTMSQLERFGVVSHIFKVYNKLTNPEVVSNAKN